MKKGFVTVGILLLSTVLNASGEIFVELPQDVKLGNRQSKVLSFPGVDTSKGRVVVDFRCRIDYPRAAGWCPCWQIEVNGKAITAAATRSETRLLNRPYYLNNKWHGRYPADNRSDKWYALYLPDFKSAERHFNPPAISEATRIVLDISDLLHVDSTNAVTLRAGGVSGSFYKANGVTDRTPGVVFGGIKIYREKELSRIPRVEEKVVRADLTPPRKARFKLKRSDDVLSVEMTAGGSRATGTLPLPCGGGSRATGTLPLPCGDESRTALTVPISSKFSIPGGGEAEMGGGNRIATRYYTVSRRVVMRDNRIDVYDTFVSKTNALIGVKVRYEIPQKGFDPVYVAGDSSPSAEEFPGGRNPSVFGVHGKNGLSVALLAQDDVFRVQNIQYCKDGFFGIRTDGLALKPGEPRTVEWSIYPVASDDYYDFVNAVRRDWDVNFPIAGSFNLSMNMFYRFKEESAKRLVRNFGLTMNSFGCHIWSHLGGKYKEYKDVIFGMGMNSPKVRVKIDSKRSVLEDPKLVHEFQRGAIANARRYTPDLKVFSYIHNQISVGVDDDKYEEWRMVNAKGRKMNYNGGATQKLFVPTKDNLFGRDFMKLVDWYFDNLDLDGIYHDELNHCNSRIYYGDKMWDGATVELDDRNNVKRKLSFVCLLKLDFTLDLFDHIMNRRRKLLVGNFSPETRSERKFRFPRFEETYSSRWIALSHLYTPIQLGDMLTYANTPKDMAADQRMALKRGALYYHYCGGTGCPTLSSKMFPFTPVELHGGWLVGEERILTAVSGEFGWRGKKHLSELFVFNELGREVPGYPAEVVASEYGVVTKLELKPDHCASMVKIPVDAEISGNVCLSGIHWDAGVFACTAEGEGEVRFTVSDGKTVKVDVNGRRSVSFGR